MTSEQFLAQFEAHLRVAEPKRSEIVAETESHIAERQELGDPKTIAQALNRVHLGIIHTENRLVIAAIALPVLQTLWAIGDIIYTRTSGHSSISDSAGFTLTFYFWFFGPAIIALYLGRLMARWHSPARLFMRIWVAVIMVCSFLGIMKDLFMGQADLDVPNTVGGLLLSAFFTSVAVSTFSAAFAMIGIFLASNSPVRIHGQEQKHQRFQLMLASSFALITVIWMAQMGSTMNPKEFILAHGPGLIMTGWLLVYTYKKYRLVRQKVLRL